MHHIYAGAYLTLSALGAENGDAGLFLPRRPVNIKTRERIKEILGEEKLLWDTELVGPLRSRGWVFQEHQLSARLVHFGKKRLLWECRSTIAYEDRPRLLHRSAVNHGVPENGDAARSSLICWRFFDGPEERRSTWGHNWKGRNDVYTQWLRMAEQYSECCFTFPDHRLSALSGLASAYSTKLDNGEYMAGLWAVDRVRSLLWCPEKHLQKSPPRFNIKVSASRRIHTIPSWSWASYNEAVRFICLQPRYFAPSCDPFVKGLYGLVDPHDSNAAVVIQTTPVSDQDKFGPVKDGLLTISSKTTRVWFKKTWSEQSSRHVYSMSYEDTVYKGRQRRLYFWFSLAEYFMEESIETTLIELAHNTFSCGLITRQAMDQTYQRVRIYILRSQNMEWIPQSIQIR